MMMLMIKLCCKKAYKEYTGTIFAALAITRMDLKPRNTVSANLCLGMEMVILLCT